MNDKIAKMDELLVSILNIRGAKILTLITSLEPAPFVIDVSAEGLFGYETAHETLFKAKLFSAFNHSGGLIIRQFLPIKVEREMPDGEKLWVPIKNIYGAQIVVGDWFPLSKNEIKRVHCTDAKTGQWLKPEPDVSFRDFPRIKF